MPLRDRNNVSLISFSGPRSVRNITKKPCEIVYSACLNFGEDGSGYGNQKNVRVDQIERRITPYGGAKDRDAQLRELRDTAILRYLTNGIEREDLQVLLVHADQRTAHQRRRARVTQAFLGNG